MTTRYGSAVSLVMISVYVLAALPGCVHAPQGSEAGAEALVPPPVKNSPARTQYPITMTDGFGNDVTLEAAPERIVSLNPAITEVLFALGLGERVVGVTRFCDYPAEAREKQEIGGIIDASEEKIISLEPDLVLGTLGNPLPMLETLQKDGMTVFADDRKTYVGAVEMVEVLGKLCDANDAAAEVAGKMREAADEVAKKVASLPEDGAPSALLIVWLDPLHVAGPGTYLDDMLTLCGARNAAAETQNPWKRYSPEMAVAANPDVLIWMADHSPGAEDREEKLNQLRADERWRTISAVQNDRVAFVDADVLSRTSPRLADGLKQMAAAVHPDVFPSQEAVSTLPDASTR